MSTSPVGARQGRKQSPSLAGRTRLHPVHVDHREKKGRVDAVHRKETRSTMDQRVLVYHEPRSRPRAVDHGPVEAHGYDVAAPQLATCPG